MDRARQTAQREQFPARRRDRISNEHSISKWNSFVIIVGAVIAELVLLLLYDLTSNILPAMRRMHANLRRLADDELDIEVEHFTLHELKDLAGPLETFRRKALAVKNLVFTDPLTGLPNRRAIIEQATERLDRFAAGDGPMTVLLVADIDRFKHVNDEFGHAAGDRLVQLVAERMKEHLADVCRGEQPVRPPTRLDYPQGRRHLVRHARRTPFFPRPGPCVRPSGGRERRRVPARPHHQ